MKIITDTRYKKASQFEGEYWLSRRSDPVGILKDLDSPFDLLAHLQRENYLNHEFARLLDVGCGALGVGAIYQIRAGEKYGVDPLPIYPPSTNNTHIDEFVKKIQSNTRYTTSKAESLEFGDGFFDVIVCNNVLDHTHNPFQILSEIKRVLSKDGLFAFAVDTHSYRTLAYKKLLKTVAPDFGPLPGHPYEWVERTMTNGLLSQGFLIESHTPRSAKGNLLGSVKRSTWLLRHA